VRSLFLALALVLICVPVRAESIPPDSLAVLGDVFTSIRDRLWQIDDVFWHNGDYERCIATMRLIVEIDPADIDAWDSTAWLLQSELRDEEAESLLLLGIARNPDSADLRHSLGNFYYAHERFGDAALYLDSAVATGATWRTWHMLAHTHELMGDTDTAFTIWRMMEVYEENSPVPANQIDRILRGEPPSNVPRLLSESREKRKAERRQGIR